LLEDAWLDELAEPEEPACALPPPDCDPEDDPEVVCCANARTTAKAVALTTAERTKGDFIVRFLFTMLTP
jgi:hypothetical protein